MLKVMLDIFLFSHHLLLFPGSKLIEIIESSKTLGSLLSVLSSKCSVQVSLFFTKSPPDFPFLLFGAQPFTLECTNKLLATLLWLQSLSPPFCRHINPDIFSWDSGNDFKANFSLFISLINSQKWTLHFSLFSFFSPVFIALPNLTPLCQDPRLAPAHILPLQRTDLIRSLSRQLHVSVLSATPPPLFRHRSLCLQGPVQEIFAQLTYFWGSLLTHLPLILSVNTKFTLNCLISF